MSQKLTSVAAILVIIITALSASASINVMSPSNYEYTPVGFGVRDLTKVLDAITDKSGKEQIIVSLPGESSNPSVKDAIKVLPAKAESFAIARVGDEIAVVGRDEVGAMYGCFELAERLGINGKSALNIRKPIVQSPAVEFRGINPFITLPYKETDETWYFLQEDYWEGYLDLLAHARINWVDLHGMYGISTTYFHNIYPFFISSDKFPETGLEPQIAKRNLDMFNKILAMAKQRGIRFALMSYTPGWDAPGLRKSPYDYNEANLLEYNKEIVRKMIQSCPDLAMIGFRIGETGRSVDFYKQSYIPAIKESGRQIDLYTRTWLSDKSPIVDLGDAFPGNFFIEPKYNGEQFGPSYIVAGGRVSKSKSYSYQNYYSYPNSYKIIYQLRANGTHRVFPWGNPALAARANVGSTIGGAIGLCVEPIDAYYPKYDLRHKDDSPNKWYKWQYQRDWFWYTVWGRTAYDLDLQSNDKLWTSMFAGRFGKTAASDLYNAMKWASCIVPDMYTAYALGPDHRQHAPELEYGGHLKAWAQGDPFDMQNVQSPREFAGRLIKDDPSAKATPLDMARYLTDEAKNTRRYIDLARRNTTNPTPEFNDLVTELTALTYLGDYYAHKLTAASLFALMEASSDISLKDKISQETGLSKNAWDSLAAIGDEYYKPFVDELRMGTEEYTWSKEGRKLENDAKALNITVASIQASGKTGKAPDIVRKGDGKGPLISIASTDLDRIDNTSKRFRIYARVSDNRGVRSVFLKTKPFPSESDWTLMPMTLLQGKLYTAEVTVPSDGLMWCIEALDKDGDGTLWPNFRVEMPYRIILPWDPQTK